MTVEVYQCRLRRETPMRNWMTCLLIGIGAAVAAPNGVLAEDRSDAPWTPKRYGQSDLIDFGTFGQSPLALPWNVLRVEEVTNYGRIDFKHHLEVGVREVASYLDDKYKNQKPALELKKGVLPKDKSRKLHVIGTARQDDHRTFTLGNGDLRQNFIVQLKEENGRAALVYQNMALNQLYGPGAPRLAPFKPVDADPIPVK